jgi:hypothetical protein
LPRRAELARKSENWARIEAALLWLKDHQERDGHWSACNFGAASTRRGARCSYNAEFVEAGMSLGDKGDKGASFDIGVTGLALTAFAAAGITAEHATMGATLRKAVNYLRRIQRNNGAFMLEEDSAAFLAHPWATMAMAEIMAMGDYSLRPCVSAAAQFTLKAQNPDRGWRYGVRYGTSDTATTAAMVMALHACTQAGVRLDLRECHRGVAEWFGAVTRNDRTGYDRPGSENSRHASAADYACNGALDAMQICSRLFAAENKPASKSEFLEKLAKGLGANLPRWEHKQIDYYCWNFASLALYLMGDKYWLAWRKPVMRALLENQRGWRVGETKETAKTLDEHGSWDAVDAWHGAGGRVYSTAINCLTLQSEWRYTRP